MINRIIIILFGLLTTLKLNSQDIFPSGYTLIEDLIENIARNSDDELDYTTLFNDLSYFLENPLNLNTASVDELERLHFLTDFQIMSLKKYISENGELLTIYELPLVYGYNEEIARLIGPFVTVESAASRQGKIEPSGFLKQTDNQLFIRTTRIFQEQKGYADVPDSIINQNPNDYYPGSQFKLYTRYSFEYKDRIRAGYTGEKDAG